MEMLANLDWGVVTLWIVALCCMAGGLAGTVFPALPGLPLIAIGGWLIGWAGDYAVIGWKTIAALVVLAVIGIAVDTLAQAVGAKKAGASKEGLVGSVVGTVAGVFMGGFIGILFMPLVGAAIGEFVAKRDLLHAGRVGIATWVGMIVGTAVKIALAFTMIGLLFIVYFAAS